MQGLWRASMPRETVSRAVGPAEALTAPEMTWLSSTGAVCALLG